MYCPFFILNDRGKDPSKPAAPIVRFCPKIFLAFSRDLYYTRIHMYAGVLELVDEADSKSVGLITRAGSTPATGTIFAPKCHASEHFLLPRSKILNIFRKRRENCICRRNLTGKIQMCVNIGSSADVAVSQPLLNLFQAHTIGIQQTGTAMPLRYNYDKPGKP